jgi:hypothetical protein
MFYGLYPFLTYLVTLPRSLKLNPAYLPCNQSPFESHIDEDPDLKSEEVIMCSPVRELAPQVAMVDQYSAVMNNWKLRKLWKSNLVLMLHHRLRMSHCYPVLNQNSSVRSECPAARSLSLISFLFCLNLFNQCLWAFLYGGPAKIRI